MRKLMKSEDYESGSRSWKYARMLEERRGNNFTYLNEQTQKKLEDSNIYTRYKRRSMKDFLMFLIAIALISTCSHIERIADKYCGQVKEAEINDTTSLMERINPKDQWAFQRD